MTQIDKLIQKFKANPSSIKWKEIEKILKYNGYHLNRIKGSHHIYEKENAQPIIAPIHRGDTKIPYKKQCRKNLYPNNK